MDDSPDEAVPEPAAARPRGANVPTTGARGRDSKHGVASGLVAFKEAEAASARWAPPRFEQLFSYGSHAALAACLFGFAWAAGSYFSGSYTPFYALKPPPTRTVATQESVARTEMLRAAQKMAEDIRALKANVEALRAAQSQTAKETTALEGLKPRLEAVNTETGASIAELAGKVDHLQRDPAAKLSQVLERLDRIERQFAAPLATASIGAAPGKAAAGKQAQLAIAPAKPPLENAKGHPQLITNWVVRDVYDGIALVESPRGSIEVAPGEIIPGAGIVKSIERRGAGWIVITSRGLVDSARDSYQP
ncbi:MAG TPA: hypothetical protein VGP28_07995 [Methylocella sp.]|jgi:hypothetical protein|nr:hypothetical protein [Methylocella sp.]